MAFMFCNKTFKTVTKFHQISLMHCRNLFTGQRYQGYVTFFHPVDMFGFVVREDAPDKEYYFHSTDLHCTSVPRVRPLQAVQFSILESRGSNFIARDISAIDGTPLNFQHQNFKIPIEERNRLLSSLPNGKVDRHTGIVTGLSKDGNHGFILPDRLNFASLSFDKKELQTTGRESIEQFSQVEFYAEPRTTKEGKQISDRALCITRHGGGLITADRREPGSRRRMLGSMYGANDVYARIPAEFSQNRKKGYVTLYDRERLYGFLVNFDSPHEKVMTHIDDCHIFGKRVLYKNQEVEYSVIPDPMNPGKYRATHVTGPSKTILRPIYDNCYIPRDQRTTQLQPSEQRHKGHVKYNNKGFLLILPEQKNASTVFGSVSTAQCLGRKIFGINDYVEFSVKSENNQITADNITAANGKPIFTAAFELEPYLLERLNLTTNQKDLPEAPSTNNAVGYIFSYFPEKKSGSIEVEAPAGQRYRLITFNLNDCVLESNVDPENIYLQAGRKVKFAIEDRTDKKEEEVRSKKATKVTSINKEFLEVGERGKPKFQQNKSSSNQNQNEEHLKDVETNKDKNVKEENIHRERQTNQRPYFKNNLQSTSNLKSNQYQTQRQQKSYTKRM